MSDYFVPTNYPVKESGLPVADDTSPEILELGRANNFDEHRCRGGRCFRKQRLSLFLCGGFQDGQCHRTGGRTQCLLIERGWSFYKPYPGSKRPRAGIRR